MEIRNHLKKRGESEKPFEQDNYLKIKEMKNYSLCMLFVAITLTSCIPKKTIVDTSCPGYKSVDFVRNNISLKGIGIMPVLGENEKEQFRRPMGDAITKYLRLEFDPDKVISTDQVISTLNENNLSEDYSAALNNYSVSGIVPKVMVNRLGVALSVDYLLYTRLLSDTEMGLVTDGYSTNVVSVDEIYVQCQIWDTRIGDVVWEGKGGIAKLDQNESDIIEKTAEGLSKVIGRDKADGPCEDKKDLIKSIQDAATNTYLAIIGISTVACIFILLIL